MAAHHDLGLPTSQSRRHRRTACEILVCVADARAVAARLATHQHMRRHPAQQGAAASECCCCRRRRRHHRHLWRPPRCSSSSTRSVSVPCRHTSGAALRCSALSSHTPPRAAWGACVQEDADGRLYFGVYVRRGAAQWPAGAAGLRPCQQPGLRLSGSGVSLLKGCHHHSTPCWAPPRARRAAGWRGRQRGAPRGGRLPPRRPAGWRWTPGSCTRMLHVAKLPARKSSSSVGALRSVCGL